MTKLNTNMERVLNTIAEHEVRLTNLEQKQLKSDTKYDTIAELIKLGIWIAKWAFGAGIIYATAHYSDIIAAI